MDGHAVAFVGPCDVRPEFMKDVEDLKAASRIYSEEMLHFIVEHFGCVLDMAVLRQRLLMAIMAENLNRRDLGGGAFTAFKDFAQWTARERIEEAKDTGASMIVTSCPWCESNLRAGGIGMEEKMEIKNLFDLMTEAL